MNRSTGFRLGTLSMMMACVFATAAYGQPSSSHERGALTVAIFAPNPNFAPVFVAKAAGEFDKQNLDVTIMEGTGANTMPLIASGIADLTLFAFPTGLIMAARGQDSTSFLGGLRDSGSPLVGSKNITSLKQLRALGDKCKVATTTQGTQAYGYTLRYLKMPKLGLQNCQLQPAASNRVVIARLVSGQVDVIGLPLPFVMTVLGKIGGHLLISPTDPNYRQEFGLPEFLSSTYFGKTARLQEKRDLIVRFVKAMLATNALLVEKNVRQIMRYLQEFASFKNVDPETLEQSLKFILPYMGPGAVFPSTAAPGSLEAQPGYISKEVWNTSLQQIAKWDIPRYRPDAPTNAYEKRVDMSYLKAALRN